MKKSKKTVVIIAAVILILAVLLTAAFFILKYIGKTQFHKDDKNIVAETVEEVNDDTVLYNGRHYKLNTDVISVLIIGVDKKNINSDLGYGKNGQADCVFVVAANTRTKSIKIIPISRETMVDVSVYSKSGSYSGVEYEQLCLSYAYGSTPESCSQNVMKAVSRTLYGINIGSHVTIDMNGLAKYTQMIGGLQLEAIEDIQIGKKKIKTGETVNLIGDDAVDYIHDRGIDVNANNRRMMRQKQFLSALIEKTVSELSKNFSKLGSYYGAMSPYTSTDISLSQLTYLASMFLSGNVLNNIEYKMIEGNTVEGEKWTEFYPDEESVLNIVFDTFYTPVDEESAN